MTHESHTSMLLRAYFVEFEAHQISTYNYMLHQPSVLLLITIPFGVDVMTLANPHLDIMYFWRQMVSSSSKPQHITSRSIVKDE